MIPADLYTRMLEMMRDWWRKKATPTPEPTPQPPARSEPAPPNPPEDRD